MIKNYLFINQTKSKGKGVFTNENIAADKIIEDAPVIVMSVEDRVNLDKTLLHDYIFAWGEKKDQCCVALGFVSMYNHSYQSNCEYFMDFKEETIQIKTVKNIKAGEELTINYNGDWNNKKKIWFEVH
jgi:hypothetical protein